jgi:hypothetical protein
MSFISVLKTIGKDALSVLKWIGSAQGQTTIAAGEAVVGAIVPGAQGFINLGNAILSEVVKVETIGQAAAAAGGTGADKLSAVVVAVTPEILQYAQVNGLPTPTAEQIQNAVNALVAFGNALEGKAS